MNIKLLTEHDLEFLHLKGGYTGLSEYTLVKMLHCWKSHVTAHIYRRTLLNCLVGELGGMAPGTASSYLMQSNYDMDIYGEAPDKMTYTEQANKRAHCKRLTW